MVVGSEFLEVGRMAESTKGVEENDKGIEGKRGDIGTRGGTRNGGRKREEEEEEEEEVVVEKEKKEEDDDEKEVGEERAIKGKSEATCTRQQPPTSEELIINLLSPSPNATVLTRPPSLHFHLRLSQRTHEAAKRCEEQRCGGCFWNRYRDAKHGSRVRKSSNDPGVQIHKHMPARVYADARVTKQGMRCETYDSRSSLNGYHRSGYCVPYLKYAREKRMLC
ncbi:hypothetical protein ALC56_13681 [Trachymyrmex septentrionalis]|uniref:Uncharacterized protein n=1 Tax=Trachymyrmex septentrionalis TaxID=34720 RepID=A0A195EUK5_9HYME|nr:hypothetical protein ALC56_13681 [Trachymyrmex septentrionalis]